MGTASLRKIHICMDQGLLAIGLSIKGGSGDGLAKAQPGQSYEIVKLLFVSCPFQTCILFPI